MSNFHNPVMLTETLAALKLQAGKKYIDATLGGGGHSLGMLEAGVSVLAFDVDQDAINYAQENLKAFPDFTPVKANFSQIEAVAKDHGFLPVSGILFDLGVSSWQFDQPERGFSFRYEAPLDMRMDQSLTVTAADLIAALGKSELALLFSRYADEPLAKHVAGAIVDQRSRRPITTTRQLADIISNAYHRRYHTKSTTHPATKIFQALRIAVNDEIHAFESALSQANRLLEPSGRVVILTFHSGEDQAINQFIKNQSDLALLSPPQNPTSKEVAQNPRARSAKLYTLSKT